MKEYTIHRVDRRPDWSQVSIIKMEHSYLQSPDDIRAYAQIGYHADALLVHLWAEEQSIRAVETDVLGMPCEDSCLEFFFRPVSSELRYFNFEFNPNACMYLGIGQSIHDLVRLVPEDAQVLFQPKVQRFKGGWEINFQIPHQFIRRFFPTFSVAPGKTIWANCYKCSDLAEPPHYYSWSPVDCEDFTFHCPHCFGLMKFE